MVPIQLVDPRTFPTEEQRQSVLRATGMIDTPPERRFDMITSLMGSIFGTPVALITLLLEDRVWFKSKWGPMGACVARDGSWCNWILVPTAPEVLVCEDAMLDARFSGSPYVRGPPHIRFYAGAPLIGRGGMRYGTLCVIDLKPRSFSAEMYSLLNNFAELAVQELERDMGLVEQLQSQSAAAVQLHERACKQLSGTTEAVVLLDVRRKPWRMLYVNDAFAKRCGAEVDAFASSGQGFWELFEPVSVPGEAATVDCIDAAVGNRSPVRFFVRCKLSGQALCMELRPASSDQMFPEKPVGVPNWVPSELTTSAADAGADTSPPCTASASASLLKEGGDSSGAAGTGAGATGTTAGAAGAATAAAATAAAATAAAATAAATVAGATETGEDTPQPLPSSSFWFAIIDPHALLPAKLHPPKAGEATQPAAAAAGPAASSSTASSTTGADPSRLVPLPSSASPAAAGPGTPEQAEDKPCWPARTPRPTYGRRKVPAELAGLQLGLLIGSGSFGKVYRGIWQGGPVAVKIIQCQEGSKRVQSAIHEASISEGFDHPNVVKTFHCWQHVLQVQPDTDYAMWILQQLCTRGTLLEAAEVGELRQERSLAAPTSMLCLLRCLWEVAAGMAYLHARGIIHRDLTGKNVLLDAVEPSSTDPRGFVCRVADFGLAKLAQGERVDTATFGTVTHMPPELLRDGLLTPTADVWSFGVLCWEAYCGTRSYPGLPLPNIIYRITSGTGLLELPPGAPDGLKALVASCLNTDHQQRPTFSSVLSTVEQLLAMAEFTQPLQHKSMALDVCQIISYQS